MEILIPATKPIFMYAFQREKPYCFSNEGLDLVYDHIVALPPNSARTNYDFDTIREYYKENTLCAFLRIYKEAVLDDLEYREEFPMLDQIRELDPHDKYGVDLIVEKDIEQAKKIVQTFLEEANDGFFGFVVTGTTSTEVSVVYEAFL